MERLRKSGFFVASVLEDAPGSTDMEVLERALTEERILVTLDKDFGALVYRGSKQHVGVLYLRLRTESVTTIVGVCESVLTEYGDRLQGRFTTASETSIRIR